MSPSDMARRDPDAQRRPKARSAHTKAAAKRSRAIPTKAKIFLAVRSGGRCEFSGCNQYLFEHPLTLRDGNFSEYAHILPFSKIGPRADEGHRPDDIHSPDNLMLLCAPCHKEIDDHPKDYPRSLLESYKRTHEERIRHVTGLGPDQRTTVVQLKARIAGQAVDIPATHIYEAISPRYPSDKQGHVIDLTQFGDENSEEYYGLAMRAIQQRTEALYRPGMDIESTRHISLFALGSIPLLVFLGSCLSNKIAVDFFQRHRDQQHPWTWPEDGDLVTYAARRLREGTEPARAALILSLSGVNRPESLPSHIDATYSIYEITLENRAPGVDFLRHRSDIEAFRRTYRTFLTDLHAAMPKVTELHLFPAVPAPIAVCCGYDLLPKVHATLVVYDRDKKHGGFISRLRVNDHDPK